VILYTIKEAAAELGISPISVRRKTKLGEISHRRLGGLIRYTPQDLQDYVDRSAVPAKAARQPAEASK
jgi:excisionase family DNA binding protein